MYIVDTSRKNAKKPCYLLRRSYRQGKKVRNETIANLSKCSENEIKAIKLALKNASNLEQLVNIIDEMELRQGRSVGAVFTIFQIAKKLGIVKALGNGREAKLALWQVIARVLAQGSRLSAMRLAEEHASCEILNITNNFSEDALYRNLEWLSSNQRKIERKLLHNRRKTAPQLFLYDVTSSYFEGIANEYAAFGYNRDKKKGKKQVVVGLLCDEQGMPVSVELFAGNTSDPETFDLQLEKVINDFGGKDVTFVGDRGMIKSLQQQSILKENYHYITALTKRQIRKLVNEDKIQLGLFDSTIAEVEGSNCRYIVRRNPIRAEEIAYKRRSKLFAIESFCALQNRYLSEHKRARVDVALRKLNQKIEKLSLNSWLSVSVDGRVLRIHRDEEALYEQSKLDGCYVLKTDLSKDVLAEVIHSRYRDLSLIEQAFRISKTVHLQMRPWFVRKSSSSRGHALVVMLAYMIVRELSILWNNEDCTVQEGLNILGFLCVHEVYIRGEYKFNTIPKPSAFGRKLLKRAGIVLPKSLPPRKANVVIRKQLQARRKSK